MKRLFVTCLCLISLNAFAEERIMTVKHLSNASSYFNIQVQDSGLLKGSYPGWCSDWARKIEDDTPYIFKFYSSYSQNIPQGLIDHPENLDEFNWVINQNFPGKDAGSGLGTYTAGDVQLSVWTLLDDSFESGEVGPFSQARVDQIVSLAQQNGAGFYPTCKHKVGIILDSGTPQTTIIEVKRKRFHKCVIPESSEF